ncbi:50S ribosomal protein L35 [Candidatus Margulisiibacteriota bacterium]
MPKLKTKKSAAKRFKVTGNKKFLRRKAGISHLLGHEDSGEKRARHQKVEISPSDEYKVARMLPYRGK